MEYKRGRYSWLLRPFLTIRYTSALNILSLLVKQFLLFSIVVYAFIGVFRSINIQAILDTSLLLVKVKEQKN